MFHRPPRAPPTSAGYNNNNNPPISRTENSINNSTISTPPNFFETAPFVPRPVPTYRPTLYIPPSLQTDAPTFTPLYNPEPTLTKPPSSAAGSDNIPSILSTLEDPFADTPTTYYSRPEPGTDAEADDSNSPTILYEFGTQVTMEPPPSAPPSRRGMFVEEDAGPVATESPTETTTTVNSEASSEEEEEENTESSTIDTLQTLTEAPTESITPIQVAEEEEDTESSTIDTLQSLTEAPTESITPIQVPETTTTSAPSVLFSSQDGAPPVTTSIVDWSFDDPFPRPKQQQRPQT